MACVSPTAQVVWVCGCSRDWEPSRSEVFTAQEGGVGESSSLTPRQNLKPPQGVAPGPQPHSNMKATAPVCYMPVTGHQASGE